MDGLFLLVGHIQRKVIRRDGGMVDVNQVNQRVDSTVGRRQGLQQSDIAGSNPVAH
jgi:hypothetical protein